MKQNTSFAFYFVVFSLLMLYGCSNAEKEPLTVDNILTTPDEYVGQTVTVKGKATHVCAKSGMKLFLEGSREVHTIRVESNSTLGKFDKACVDNEVVVKGILVEEKITEADLKKMEEEIVENRSVTHGEDGEACETEQKAEGVATGSSEMDRVNQFRERLAERKASEGKDYLSFYHIAANSYSVVEK